MRHGVETLKQMVHDNGVRGVVDMLAEAIQEHSETHTLYLCSTGDRLVERLDQEDINTIVKNLKKNDLY